MPRRYILTIDGGGIRGIIPACMLVRLEEMTGKPARETFDFVAGTSTGAVIAGGLAAGIPAARILAIYMNRAEEVFPQRPWNVLKRIALGHMYSTHRLRDVLAEEAGAAAGWSLNDAPLDVLITAKRVTDGLPWYFVRDNPANAGRTGVLNLVDCITASAAAPTYFAPWTMHDLRAPPGEDPRLVLTDGGVGVAGNPIYQTCVEAFHYTAPPYDPQETTIISLGTGRSSAIRPVPGWLWPWLKWILNELLDSAGEQQTELARRHYAAAMLYRLDPTLPYGIGSDQVGRRNELRQAGEQFAAQIDWEAILCGEDSRYLIGGKTLPFQYQKA
jgi:patatin-like phospholipase/acyl hydrolase